MMIVNDDSRVVNKLEASLTDNARVVIYVRHMFIVQATEFSVHKGRLLAIPVNIRLIWEGFPGINGLAYLSGASPTKEKPFRNIGNSWPDLIRHDWADVIGADRFPAKPLKTRRLPATTRPPFDEGDQGTKDIKLFSVPAK
jgi:hypothetical protein